VCLYFYWMELFITFLSLLLGILTIMRQIRKPSADFTIFMLLLCVFTLQNSCKIFIDENIPVNYISVISWSLSLLYAPLLLLYFKTVNNYNTKSAIILLVLFLVVSLSAILIATYFPLNPSLDEWKQVLGMAWIISVLFTVFNILPARKSSDVKMDFASKSLKIKIIYHWALVILVPFLVELTISIFPSDNFLFPYRVLVPSQTIVQVVFSLMLSLLSWELYLSLKNLEGNVKERRSEMVSGRV
jgi:hypothetical protein